MLPISITWFWRHCLALQINCFVVMKRSFCCGSQVQNYVGLKFWDRLLPEAQSLVVPSVAIINTYIHVR